MVEIRIILGCVILIVVLLMLIACYALDILTELKRIGKQEYNVTVTTATSPGCNKPKESRISEIEKEALRVCSDNDSLHP